MAIDHVDLVVSDLERSLAFYRGLLGPLGYTREAEIAGERFHGWGQAKRSPGDPSVPVIGEELAAARALSDLAHQLLHAAADRIEVFEGRPVHPHG